MNYISQYNQPWAAESHALWRSCLAGSGQAVVELQTLPTADCTGNPFSKVQPIATIPPCTQLLRTPTVHLPWVPKQCNHAHHWRRQVAEIPSRVRDVPSHCLIFITAKAHRWRQNQPDYACLQKHINRRAVKPKSWLLCSTLPHVREKGQ